MKVSTILFYLLFFEILLSIFPHAQLKVELGINDFIGYLGPYIYYSHISFMYFML
jgi:hypothetical protein